MPWASICLPDTANEHQVLVRTRMSGHSVMIAEMEGLAEGEKIARKEGRHAGRVKSRAHSVRARLYAGALHVQISPEVSGRRLCLVRQTAAGAARAPCAG